MEFDTYAATGSRGSAAVAYVPARHGGGHLSESSPARNSIVAAAGGWRPGRSAGRSADVAAVAAFVVVSSSADDN